MRGGPLHHLAVVGGVGQSWSFGKWSLISFLAVLALIGAGYGFIRIASAIVDYLPLPEEFGDEMEQERAARIKEARRG